MAELQRLDLAHEGALLAFELANRAYFAESISDRGDRYFEQFAEELGARLVDEDGSVLGRFNLLLGEDQTAVLGFRMAQHAAGRGLATTAVEELCRLAPSRYGVRRMRASCSLTNAASQRVLTKSGFVPVGPADPAEVGGTAGTRFERDLDKA